MKSSLRNQQIPQSNSAVISLCFLIMLHLIVQRENYKKSTHHHSQINAAFPLKDVLLFSLLTSNPTGRAIGISSPLSKSSLLVAYGKDGAGVVEVLSK